MAKSKPATLNKIEIKEIIPDQEFIVQKITRIDGHQTIKKYHKLDLLGKGGFANCFVTENVQNRRQAATKIIQKDLLTSQKTKLRLLNQIRLHKTLRHPNVVEFEHYFEDKNNVYIFLELCENQSLNQIIKVRQYFSTAQVQFFMFGIVKGIQYLHNKSIIHRDLKLGNIFLDNKFNIKLGDFGLATKLQFRKQNKRTICGTPNYIAPQVLQGKGYHFGIDIWSIGVILYTLFYTIPPFQTQEASTTYQKIKNCQYDLPNYLLVPTEANDLIKRILVKNPADRPTLDQILDSDFMKLGNKIYTQLPAICSKKAPTKKDLSNCSFITHQQALLQLQCISKTSQSIKIENTQTSTLPQNVQYLINFEKIANQHYFFTTNIGSSIIQKQNQLLSKDSEGVFKTLKMYPKSQTEKVEDHQLKDILNYKDKLWKLERFNKSVTKINEFKQTLLETTLYPVKKSMLYVKKLSQQSQFLMVRLSNSTIQLFFKDQSNYLITKSGAVHFIDKQFKISDTINLVDVEQQVKKAKKSKISYNLTQKKINYIRALLTQIQKIKSERNKQKTSFILDQQNQLDQSCKKQNVLFKKTQSETFPFRQIINE